MDKSQTQFNIMEFLRRFIACQSITPTDNGAMKCVVDTLEMLGFSVQEYSFGNGDLCVKNIYASFKGRNKGANLCFVGHVDVVPPGDLSQWTHHPFTMHQSAGRIYGRGMVDMKGSIACYIAAVAKFIAEKHDQFNGELSFVITGDEEGVAQYGTKMLLEKIHNNNVKLDYCIVGEPTSIVNLGDNIKIGRRGSIMFDLVVYGVQGHVAYPHLAHNPIDDMLAILMQLREMHLDEGSEFFQPSNIVITAVDVNNIADNIIPAAVQATINIRFNTHHTAESLERRLHNICVECSNNYRLIARCSGEAFITQQGKLVDVSIKVIGNLLGLQTKVNTDGGTSDARFVKDYCDEIVEIGLLNTMAHKVDENAVVEDLEKLQKVYYGIIRDLMS